MMIPTRAFAAACIILLAATASAADFTPIVRFVDLNIGESQAVTLSNGKQVTVKLLDVKEERDPNAKSIWRSTAIVDIDGDKAEVVMTTMNLPKTVGKCQIDCIATRNYVADSYENYWEIHKDARLRLWPKGSPWIEPGTFVYPLQNVRWMAANVGYSNIPAASRPNGKFYYHAGMDTGAVEKITPVIAATDGLVVQLGNNHLSKQDHPPILPRYDVIYLRDDRGWYYRYSHLSSFDSQIKLGKRVKMGQRIGFLGKEGESGGWTHLHFEIVSLTPDGKYGTQDGYAYWLDSYIRKYNPAVIAVAQPRRTVRSGDAMILDASRSWSKKKIARCEWTLHDGKKLEGMKVPYVYPQPGSYREILKVTDEDGNFACDIMIVNVIGPEQERPRAQDRGTSPSAQRGRRDRGGPSTQAFFYPTLDIKPGDPVYFSSRGNGGDGFDVYDFDDGTTTVRVRSNIDTAEHAENGYGLTVHHFAKPGHYFVKVSRTDPETGRTGYHLLDVPVGIKP